MQYDSRLVMEFCHTSGTGNTGLTNGLRPCVLYRLTRTFKNMQPFDKKKKKSSCLNVQNHFNGECKKEEIHKILKNEILSIKEVKA